MNQSNIKNALVWPNCSLTPVAYNHSPFKCLQNMARQGLLPQRLERAWPPLCSGCAYGKATRKPWCTRMSPSKTPRTEIIKPSSCISIDQLESSTSDLVVQLKGIPTKARYRGATVFVDHYRSLIYIYTSLWPWLKPSMPNMLLKLLCSFSGITQIMAISRQSFLHQGSTVKSRTYLLQGQCVFP